MSLRVRFAPSPTGALHIGGARTALYNWLLARGQGGTLVLRIEDTDRERSTPENVEQILDALKWLNLDYDEGPVLQSQRADRHAEVVARLLADGHAYHSTATTDDVRAYKQRHGSDRGFRGEPEATGAVRLRVPDTGETVVSDVVRGEVAFPNTNQDDPVIARADGTPVYNLAVAVDDLDAGITHVVRGEDHISNTPKQMWVLQALGAPVPHYAHLSLLYGPDGKKLSKRHGAASVQELREAGYLPEAVDNYIALLGAGFASDEEFFSLPELAERFRLERVSKNPAIFDEQKLRHLNGRHLRALGTDTLTARLEQFTERTGLRGAVEITEEKIQTLSDFWPLVSFLFDGPVDDPAAFDKIIRRDGGAQALTAARDALAQAEPFDAQRVETALRGVVERLDTKPGKVFQPVRVAIAGQTVSPGIFESVALLGKDETLARIQSALARADREDA
jgi:glutamyl-tRNA synthetase